MGLPRRVGRESTRRSRRSGASVVWVGMGRNDECRLSVELSGRHVSMFHFQAPKPALPYAVEYALYYVHRIRHPTACGPRAIL